MAKTWDKTSLKICKCFHIAQKYEEARHGAAWEKITYARAKLEDEKSVAITNQQRPRTK